MQAVLHVLDFLNYGQCVHLVGTQMSIGEGVQETVNRRDAFLLAAQVMVLQVAFDVCLDFMCAFKVHIPITLAENIIYKTSK